MAAEAKGEERLEVQHGRWPSAGPAEGQGPACDPHPTYLRSPRGRLPPRSPGNALRGLLFPGAFLLLNGHEASRLELPMPRCWPTQQSDREIPEPKSGHRWPGHTPCAEHLEVALVSTLAWPQWTICSDGPGPFRGPAARPQPVSWEGGQGSLLVP